MPVSATVGAASVSPATLSLTWSETTTSGDGLALTPPSWR